MSMIAFGRLCWHNFKHDQNEHYFKLLSQFSTASIIRAVMRWKQKKKHCSSRIIQFLFYSVLFSENIEVCAKAHTLWSAYDSSSQATTPLARRLGPSGLRSKMASSSSTSTSSTSSPFSASSAVPRASISREGVPKSNTGKYKERSNWDPKNLSLRDRIEELIPSGKFVSSRRKTVLQWVLDDVKL